MTLSTSATRKKPEMLHTASVRQMNFAWVFMGLQMFLMGGHLIPTATEDVCLVWKQMPWSTG